MRAAFIVPVPATIDWQAKNQKEVPKQKPLALGEHQAGWKMKHEAKDPVNRQSTASFRSVYCSGLLQCLMSTWCRGARCVKASCKKLANICKYWSLYEDLCEGPKFAPVDEEQATATVKTF